jgi:phenylacetate-CoA ligase
VPADPLRARLVATARVLAQGPRDRRLPFRSAEAVADVRDARLRSLVRYAAEEVPYYRDLFFDRRIDPREVRTAADLRTLPLLDKEIVQRDTDRFRPLSPARERAVPFPTSGSSGTPLTVFHEPDALLRYLTVGEREREPVRRLVGRRRYRTVALSYNLSSGDRARAFHRRATLLPSRPRRGLPLDAPPERIAAVVTAERPDVLAGWGNRLELLFALRAAGDIRFPLPKVVRYYADAMSEEGRRLIEERFRIPVLSAYASVETFRIGFSCEWRSGLHVHDDVCHVRVVDPGGAEAPPGEPGEVVVSNLVNRGTVLLNYRLGDVAALLRDPCPCGRSLPLLGALQGRVSEIVRLRDGSLVHPTAISALLRPEDGLLRFRLVQEALDRFRLEAVTVDDAAYRRLVADVLPELTRVLKGAQVDLVRRKALEETPRVKYRRVVALAAEGA